MHDLPPSTSATESFLKEFHAAHPCVTSRILGKSPVACNGQKFPSTYALLANIVPDDSASRSILDLACGDGFLLSMLNERESHDLTLHGIDMSAEELARVPTQLGSRVTLHHANAQCLPLPADAFDFVLCHLALMLMDDVETVLQEVRRVLKPGGVFAAVVGAGPSQSPAAVAYVAALKRRSRLEKYAEVRFGDRRVRTCEGIQSLLAPAFAGIAISDITRSNRMSPAELWASFQKMYDLYLFAPADREIVRKEFFAAAALHVDDHGLLEHVETSRLVTAVA